MDEVVCSILRNYPSTRITDFRAHYKQGGLTYPQIEFMYESCIKDKLQDYEIIGSFHGIKMSGKGKSAVPSNQLPPGVDRAEHFVFGAPADYAKMSEAEREALTQKMLANHESFAGSSKLGKV